MFDVMDMVLAYASKLKKAERMPDPVKGLPMKAFILANIPDHEIQWLKQDPHFIARVQYWQACPTEELKTACKQAGGTKAGFPVGRPKYELVLNLARKRMPATVPEKVPDAAKTPPTASKKRKATGDGEQGSAAKKVKPTSLAAAKGKLRLPKEEASLLKPAEAKKELNCFVKSLACSVHDNWHDGYEYQAEEQEDWFKKCIEYVTPVLNVSIANGAAFHHAHEILKHIADTWAVITKMDFRGGANEEFDGEVEFSIASAPASDLQFSHPREVLSFVWPLLLSRAAGDGSVPDLPLLQMIRDAADRGVASFEVRSTKAAESSGTSFDKTLLGADLARGEERLAGLVARKEEWSALPSTKRNRNPPYPKTKFRDREPASGCSDAESDDGWW